MRVLYTLGLFLLVIYVEAQYEPMKPELFKRARRVQAYCQKETNISNELLLQSRKNIFPNDRSMQCFLQCNLNIAGLMNKDNEISLEPLKIFVPESWHELITNIQNFCGTKAGADACEIAYNTFLCYAEQNKELPMII